VEASDRFSPAPAPPETAPAVPAAPIEPERVPRPSVRRETPIAPPPIREASPPVRSASPPEPIAVPAAPPEDAPPAEAPFFELKQVSEPPQVSSRVEPLVPDEVKGPLDDLVLVRVLVSQAGRPALVSVLRGSKAGTALDDAVVAAVKRWRFSPARKGGQAVSCWYYFGVPVTRGD
jgi:protein TonB